MDADWMIDQKDLIRLNSRATVHDTFTRIYVLYRDAGDGSQQEVHADAGDTTLGLLEEVVRVRQPMTRERAQGLADEAAAVLGGPPVERCWITIDGGQPLQHRTGPQRPAREIREGDTVRHSLQRRDRPLHVFDVREDAEGVVHLAMADQNLSARLDTELRLLLAEDPQPGKDSP